MSNIDDNLRDMIAKTIEGSKVAKCSIENEKLVLDIEIGPVKYKFTAQTYIEGASLKYNFSHSTGHSSKEYAKVEDNV